MAPEFASKLYDRDEYPDKNYRIPTAYDGFFQLNIFRSMLLNSLSSHTMSWLTWAGLRHHSFPVMTGSLSLNVGVHMSFP